MTTESSEDDFKVGYKCPPQHSRFQPGSSGNPAGKQKAVRNLGSDVKRIADVVIRLGLTQSDSYLPAVYNPTFEAWVCWIRRH
jgi:hypothetical protein